MTLAVIKRYMTDNIHTIQICGRRIKGVLFDLDGVLVDSETEYTRIWSTIQKEFSHSMPDTASDDFSKKIKGTTLDNILSTYFPDPEIQPMVRNRLYEEEEKMVYRYCPGAKELLTTLKRQGIPMALFTSSNEDKMRHLYRDIPEIRDYFDAMVVADDVHRSKPDPEGYLLAAARLGIAPSDCCVMEDSIQGMRAGKAAGAFVIGIAGTLPAKMIESEADCVADGVKSVLPKIR